MRGLYSMLLFVIACAAADDFHWIFVHYHKTGHDLARKLSSVFRTRGCSVSVRQHYERRVFIQTHLATINQNHISVMAGPDIHVPWNGSLLQEFNGTVRLVHFLRDPYDMILSGYLYHAQEEAPPLEVWLKSLDFHPCAADTERIYNVFAVPIGVDYGNYWYIARLIAQVLETCDKLYAQAVAGKRKNYNDALRSLTKQDGVLLEAARSILSATGGDILRMAANCIYEKNTRNSSTHRVFLSDFAVGNKTRFRQSSQHLFDFLMRDPGDHQRLFWSCLTVDQAVQRSVELAFLPGNDSKAKGAAGHVTQGLVTAAERAQLLGYLHSHPAIGPLLDVVSEIVQY